MLPKKVMDGFFAEGYGHRPPNRIFPEGPERKIHVFRPAIRQNMMKGTKSPTVVVIDEFGERHFYHAVKADGFLGFDPDDPDANVYIITTKMVHCYLDPEGDGPFISPTPEKPETIGGVIWRKLMGFRRKTRRGMYVGWWGFRKYTPIVNCLFSDPGELKPAGEQLVVTPKVESRHRC